MIYSNILDLIGNTPLVKYSDNIFLKLEFMNPSGSIKARAAYSMINEAIKSDGVEELFQVGKNINFDLFSPEYLEKIKYICLVMSEGYIRKHFAKIKEYASVIENRLDDEGCTIESVLADNAEMLALAQKYNVNYILISDEYESDLKKALL